MDYGSLLLRLALALFAARAAAEIAERFRQPAVLAEIAAGVVLGPSLLGLIHPDNVIRSLGELGAVLLLFEVGLHMDLGELRRVGRAAMQVATIGVLVPMALGYPVLRAFGVAPRIAVFLAAGITATSVGITARVFSDLRSLASVEARTVLGAAVADDVMGLVILAIVVGAESRHGVAAGSIIWTVALALAFLVVATAAGTSIVPRVIGWLGRVARTDGTALILALVVALSLAGAASRVKLAPVVGAFVAGLAVAPSPRRDEVQRRLQPLGQVLIPLFFLQIGVETSARAFGQARVLEIAAALALVAVAGKIVAGLGVKRGTADRFLVGIAMIPRGEVGLIFASIGLSQHFLDPRSHSILVVVVMASTVVAPASIRWRIRRVARRGVAAGAAQEPPGGWLRITHDDVELAAEPPPALAGAVGLDAAVACATRRPGERLLSWLSELPPGADEQPGALRDRVFRLLHEGGVRSWRFLEVTGLLGRVLPEIDAALRNRARDPFDLDPSGSLRWETLEGLHALEANARDPASELWLNFAHPELVRTAALARDAFDEGEAASKTSKLASTLGLDELELQFVVSLVVERHLLPAASRRIDMGAEDSVLELAAHLSSVELGDALYILAVAEDAMDATDRERLDELHGLVRQVLAHPEVADLAGGDLLTKRRMDAQNALAGSFPDRVVRDHLEAAPARYLLAQPPAAIARHILLAEPRPSRFETRLVAEPGEGAGDWTLDVAFLDRHGALAAVAGALASCGVGVQEAFISTWRSGIAIDVFKVTARDDVDWGRVRDAIAGRLEQPVGNGEPGVVEGTVDIDNQGSPWHTIVEVRARDRTGLLSRVASALARAGADIHSAQVSTRDGVAIDTFAVTGSNGAKLDDAGIRALHLAFAGKPVSRWRSPLRRLTRAVRR